MSIYKNLERVNTLKYLGATLADNGDCGDDASILLKEMRVCVCLQNWTNFCPYGLNSTPIST